jgi:hypothetical protein
MGNITKVPNGPLVKKKGPFKGSTLKKGGPIKKAQNGLTQAELDALSHQKRGMGTIDKTFVKKAGGVKNETGTLTDAQVAQLKKYMSKAGTAKKIYEGLPNVGRILGHGNSSADIPKGSQLERQRKGGVIKKKAKAGAMIKRADGSMSRRGLWDNLRSKAAQNKKTGAKPKAPTKAMLTQEKKIKSKGK